MIKTVLFDVYGMVIDREMRFSQRFSKDFSIPLEKLLPFFQNEFQLCLIGKSDLKIELKKYLKEWGWQESTDELLKYWFGHEKNISEEMLESVRELRKAGIKCYINTQNEKYIVEYISKTLGLEKYFDGVFCTNKIGYKKPEQRYWESIYNQLGKPNKKTVLVWDDDTKHIEAAKEFGFAAELYKNFAEYKNKINFYLNK